MADWISWHDAYAEEASPLSRRLAAVRGLIGGFLERRPEADLRALSVCAGDGRDLLATLAPRADGARVSARLVELDPLLARRAAATACAAGLERVQIVCGDAGQVDAFAGAVPADLVLLCGVFGNISMADVRGVIGVLPQLCRADALVIWTRHRRPPDRTPQIRRRLESVGFVEEAFISPGADAWSVGAHRFAGTPRPLAAGLRLFTFER